MFLTPTTNRREHHEVTRKGNRVSVTINAMDPDEVARFLQVCGPMLPSDLAADIKSLKSSTSVGSLLSFARKHPAPFERE
jgi:hypothetical protein